MEIKKKKKTKNLCFYDKKEVSPFYAAFMTISNSIILCLKCKAAMVKAT